MIQIVICFSFVLLSEPSIKLRCAQFAVRTIGPNEWVLGTVRDCARSGLGRAIALELLYDNPGNARATLACLEDVNKNGTADDRLWMSSIAARLPPSQHTADLQRRLISESDNQTVKLVAASKLAGMGAMAVPHIRKLLFENSSISQRIGCRLAERLGADGAELFSDILFVAIWTDEATHEAAVAALISIGFNRATAPNGPLKK